MPMVLDSTKIQQFMDCPRSYFYRYVLGWQQEEPNVHLIFGEAWHVAMEYLLLHGYTGGSIIEAFDQFLAVYEEQGQQPMLEGNKTADTALRALTAYAQRYASDLDRFTVKYTEVVGEAPLTEDQSIAFRIDAILEDKKGQVFVLEHKTASSNNRQWFDQWQLKTQIGTYSHVLRCITEEEQRGPVVINATFFAKKEQTLERIPINKTVKDMQTWYINTCSWVSNILHQHALLQEQKDAQCMSAFPMNTESCTKYFGCPYHDFCCSWSNPQTQGFIPTGYVEKHWSPFDAEQRRAKYVLEKGEIHPTIEKQEVV